MTIYDVQQRLSKFNLFKAVEFAINNSSEKMEDLQVDQQRQGKRENDSEISPFYRPSTVRDKRREGKIFDHVTLEDEGNFHKSVVVFSEGFVVTFTSMDWKTKTLEDKYGIGIFGLNYENSIKARQFLIPLIKSFYEMEY